MLFFSIQNHPHIKISNPSNSDNLINANLKNIQIDAINFNQKKNKIFNHKKMKYLDENQTLNYHESHSE